MLSDPLIQKFTHLFKILDFDHDGLLHDTDFQSLGENISTFRCLEPPDPVEELIIRRSREVDFHFQSYLKTQVIQRCNLNNWLGFLEALTIDEKFGSFSTIVENIVNDIFFIYDKDNDEFLSKQEYMCFFVSLRVEIKFIDICFRKLDLNKDMKLSKDELISAFMQFFLDIDTKSPGNLLIGNPENYQFQTRQTIYS